MTSTMSAADYKEQLQALCTRGGYREWPYKSLSDQHVLLKSATYWVEPDREYSEQEINDLLVQWCEQVGSNFRIDHAALRRHLVDAGYLLRDNAGHSYRLDAEQAGRIFEHEANAVDPLAAVREARREIEERRRKYSSHS